MILSTSRLLPDLYEADETAWLDTMAELIDQGRLNDLDYPHLHLEILVRGEHVDPLSVLPGRTGM